MRFVKAFMATLIGLVMLTSAVWASFLIPKDAGFLLLAFSCVCIASTLVFGSLVVFIGITYDNDKESEKLKDENML